MVTAVQVRLIKQRLDEAKAEISRLVIGQEAAVEALFRAILANGHVLIEGMPGIAKTLLVKTLAKVLGGDFGRIQFTVDMLPSDIVGITTYIQGDGISVTKGPIFANFVIADEINRAPPKTQSALLEAMQEHQVTIGKQTLKLPSPFFVMATVNPIETSGTYPLPEAQVDRFLFKVIMGYPKKDDEKRVIEQNVSLYSFDDYKIKCVLAPKEVLRMQDITRQIGHKESIKDYIVNIVDATRHPEQYGLRLGKFIEYGASPRAAISLFISAKAQALMQGKTYILPDHVKKVATDVLRHRIILNYHGQAEGISTDDVVAEVLDKVRIP